MIDQLHIFPDLAAAEAAFPRPVDDEGNPMALPCWMAGNATVMPVTVYVMDNGSVRPSADIWYGVSMQPGENDMFWAMPSAQVELLAPKGSRFWTTCVLRSRVDAETAANVMGVSPVFSGRGYTFPEWPAEDAA